MRDFVGYHVSTVDEAGHPADVDDVFVAVAVFGSFSVHYNAGLDRICVAVRRFASYGDMSMQLTVEQARLLRALLAAGIDDATTSKPGSYPALPSAEHPAIGADAEQLILPGFEAPGTASGGVG